MQPQDIRAAEIVLPCRDFAGTLAFFTERLGFRVNMIVPADAPAVAVISGHGSLLRLVADALAAPSTLRLRLLCEPAGDEAGTILVAPDGTRIELVAARPPMQVPAGEQAFILSRNDDAEAWGTGRAGMQYRDLIPGRLGGRYIASHIRIPQGGPVPDYVHFHKVRFQMIFCKAGWAKLAYEDQGEPFRLEAGDCVLQPPEIRHRVLESSDGLEVIEIGCPAVHETFADHNLTLPTGRSLPAREFGGQLFVRHVAAETPWHDWRADGFTARDTGIGQATGGLAMVEVVRPSSSQAALLKHEGDFWFLFVLKGSIEITAAELGSHRLESGDSCTIPRGTALTLHADAEAEWLDVTLPR